MRAPGSHQRKWCRRPSPRAALRFDLGAGVDRVSARREQLPVPQALTLYG